MMRQQLRLHGFTESCEKRTLQLGSYIDCEMPCERQNIFRASAQRRNAYDIEREAVKQIGAKRALLDQFRQMLIRRTYDARIAVQRLRAANAAKLTILDDAQDLLLHTQRYRAELVEHERSSVCLFEAADMGFRGAGKSTSLMSEKLRFKQGFGERGAVDAQQPLFPAFRQVVAAMSSLPVPRSPMTSTGFVMRAASETCSSISTNAGDSPISAGSSGFPAVMCARYANF
jgi:hypothetical protein